MTKYTGQRVHHKMTLADRLIFYSARDASGCILWVGAKKSKDSPYGTLRFRNHKRSAHVWAWECANGKAVPEGMVVRHSCDVPGCINPDHLSIGSHADNAQDKERRGRGQHARGEAHGRSKLTNENIVEIRNDPRGSRPLAAQYGVSANLIKLIRRGRIWRHV